MITVYTRHGDRYTCPRVDHNHRENGRTVACTACRVDVPRNAGRWRETEDIAHSLDRLAMRAEHEGLMYLARDLRDYALGLRDVALTQWGTENERSEIAARERTARAV